VDVVEDLADVVVVEVGGLQIRAEKQAHILPDEVFVKLVQRTAPAQRVHHHADDDLAAADVFGRIDQPVHRPGHAQFLAEV